MEERKDIFGIYTRDICIADDVDFLTMAKCTDRYTGADIKSLCREASLHALRCNKDAQVVTKSDFKAALLRGPSISTEMVIQYEKFSNVYGGKF